MQDDEEKNPKPEEPKPEEPKPEEPKPEEPKPEEPKPGAGEPESAIVKRIREDYEKRIQDITDDYENKLADKDKTILSILDGAPAPTMGIAERINQRRQFKKY